MENSKSVAEIQEIVGGFVAREVYCCASDIVDRLMKKDSEFSEMLLEQIPQRTSIVNIFTDSREDFSYEELEKYKEQLAEAIDNTEDPEKLEELKDALEEAGESEFEYAEVYGYWFVSSWLAEKLKAKGEMVIEEFLTPIWGRSCTGQAIALDYVINDICKDIELI